MPKFADDVAELKDRIAVLLLPEVQTFYEKHGVLPRRVTLNAVETTTAGDRIKQHVLSRIDVEFDL